MQVQHIGLVCRSEQSADKFYHDFLGLEKGRKTTVPATLTKPLFGIDTEMTMCNYTAPGVHFEIFFHDDPREFTGRIAHICLTLQASNDVLPRAPAAGVPVRRVAKGEKWVTFIEDFDGNKFEIKQA